MFLNHLFIFSFFSQARNTGEKREGPHLPVCMFYGTTVSEISSLQIKDALVLGHQCNDQGQGSCQLANTEKLWQQLEVLHCSLKRKI